MLSSGEIFQKDDFLFSVIYMQGLSEDMLWASVSNNSLISVASLLKHCTFKVTGKVGFNA